MKGNPLFLPFSHEEILKKKSKQLIFFLSNQFIDKMFVIWFSINYINFRIGRSYNIRLSFCFFKKKLKEMDVYFYEDRSRFNDSH